MMAQLEHGHCTARSTVLAAPPAMVKDKSGGGQTAVGLDPIGSKDLGLLVVELSGDTQSPANRDQLLS